MNLYANYHTHTYHCRHASGSPQEYVEAAIRGGIRILGFSDHVPYPFSTGHRSTFRMDGWEAAQYIDEIQHLREAYRDQIQIHIGYEAEYYPKEFPAMLDHIRQYECEYLILGQHFTDNEYDGVYVNGKYADFEAVLVRYVDQLIEGMETGLFSYVAHPDILRYRADDAIYTQEMERLCTASRELGIPLEINFLGIRERRAYPYAPFWKVAGKVGAPVIFGCDAHNPASLEDKVTEENAINWAQEFGLQVQSTVELRPVGKGRIL